MINEDEEIYKTVIGDFVQRIQPQLRKFLKDPVNVDFHCALLKSVDSNFTLAVHSPKFEQAKPHILSHFREKREKKYG